MQRYKQSYAELIEKLAPVEASGLDDFAQEVILFLGSFPVRSSYVASDITDLLNANFEASMTLFRLFLGLSRDEFTVSLGKKLGHSIGVRAFIRDPPSFVNALCALGLLPVMRDRVQNPVTWRDLLIERLMAGRGRAIKGQRRGRSLEDFTENIVREVFGPDGYDVRCRFTGRTGMSTEKADFAVPSKEDPHILIESKAYGATGSKQTDILGDVDHIVEQKRHDTALLLVTDGSTWVSRASDLRRLVEKQNQGFIMRIYTVGMAADLREDLIQLKADHDL